MNNVSLKTNFNNTPFNFKGLILKQGCENYLLENPTESLSSLLDAGNDMCDFKYTDLIIDKDGETAIKFKNTSNPDYPTKAPLFSYFRVNAPFSLDEDLKVAEITGHVNKKADKPFSDYYIPLKFLSTSEMNKKTRGWDQSKYGSLTVATEIVKFLECQIAREEEGIALSGNALIDTILSKSNEWKGLLLNGTYKMTLDLLKNHPTKPQNLFNSAFEMKDYKYVTFCYENHEPGIKFRNTQNKDYPTDKFISEGRYEEFINFDPPLYGEPSGTARWILSGKNGEKIPIRFNSRSESYAEESKIKHRSSMLPDSSSGLIDKEGILIEIAKHLEHQIAREESDIAFKPASLIKELLTKFGQS